MEVNINQLMDLTGKSFRTIKKLLEPLNPVSEDGKARYWDSKEALKLLYPTHTSELAQENLKLERARREKAEIEVGELRGSLVPLADVTKAVEKEYGFVRAQIRSLPSKLAKPLAILSDAREVHTRLQEAVDECLTELTADTRYEQSRQQLESTSDSGGAGANAEAESETDTETELGGVGGHLSLPESGVE
jgi:phage terminase Nu1 subunit (DNA packaging protein)